MPIWMVDKKISGFSDNFNAALAAWLPFFAAVSSFVFLAETNAISDIDNTPFNNISTSIINTSINYSFIHSLSSVKVMFFLFFFQHFHR